MAEHLDLSKVETFERHDDLKIGTDFMFSLGGDGTLLDTIDLVQDSAIPIMGINMGRLGFLSSVAKDEIDIALHALLNGKYSLSKRDLIRAETTGNLFGDFNYALNEFTIMKKDSSSMITIEAYLNDDYMNTYWVDGLIVSTPTGSTAYSLSSGGPIIKPGADVFCITPLAPHNLNVRPMIVNDNCEIRLKIDGRDKHYLAALDARSVSFQASEEFRIFKERFTINLVRIYEQTFLNTLKTKLLWGLDTRN